MRAVYGHSQAPLVLLHGGAGPMDPSLTALDHATGLLENLGLVGLEKLERGDKPLDVVLELLKRLELYEEFNAGKGAALQADGEVRLTAAVMDSEHQVFSGVIGASYLLHPSVLAGALQSRSARVLTSPGTELLARQLGCPIESPVTARRLEAWARKKASGKFSDETCDTVGVIVLDPENRLAVGTSTGGRGFEFPGRVSDSATVAGTYCTEFAAFSATGIGEQIVDDALCARLETRCRDGLHLEAACQRSFEEALAKKRSYGWIAIDRLGFWASLHTTPAMSWALIGSKGVLSSSRSGTSY